MPILPARRLRWMTVLGLACLGCKDSPGSATPPPGDSPGLRGIIDETPFVGHAAALVHPNRPGRSSDGHEYVSSKILITEVPGDCAYFDARQSPKTRPGRSVELLIRAKWPVPAGTTLRTVDEDTGKDHVEAGLLLQGHEVGSPIGDDLIAEGTVTIVRSSAKDGVVAVDLKTAEVDHVRGEIPFIVCPY